MSDNDHITRGEARKVAYKISSRFMFAPFLILPPAEIDEMVDTIPAVPQEMSAREFFEEFQRMCHTVDGCSDCPIMGIDKCAGFPCRYRAYLDTEQAIASVEKWAREHPERSEE